MESTISEKPRYRDINKPDMVDSFKFTEQVNLLQPTTPLAWNVRQKYLTLSQRF